VFAKKYNIRFLTVIVTNIITAYDYGDRLVKPSFPISKNREAVLKNILWLHLYKMSHYKNPKEYRSHCLKQIFNLDEEDIFLLSSPVVDTNKKSIGYYFGFLVIKILSS
jgi:hypothetical protein